LTPIKKKLNRSTKDSKSPWGSEADYRLKNTKWLRYSSNIARRILASIADRSDLNQKILAERIGVKPQYINKVVKGQENLSLETIAKISDALGFELIQFSAYKYSVLNSPKPLPVRFAYQINILKPGVFMQTIEVSQFITTVLPRSSLKFA